MISLLRGIITKGLPGELIVDVSGVGYAVAVPLNVWEEAKEGHELELHTVTYVREDRLELYGFLDVASKALFSSSITLAGIGPKLGLELCSVPRHLLLTSIGQQDVRLLTSIKGVGKKTAEKLLVDLRSLVERQPDIFRGAEGTTTSSEYDQDALDALTALGYNTATILKSLKELSPDIKTSEERVAAALRSL